MPTDFAHTRSANVNRLAKATALADFMVDVRIQRIPEPDERRSIELAAGVNPGASDETWSMAIALWQVAL